MLQGFILHARTQGHPDGEERGSKEKKVDQKAEKPLQAYGFE